LTRKATAGRFSKVIALTTELALKQQAIPRFRHGIVLGAVYLSVGPPLWIVGAVLLASMSTYTYGSPYLLGVGIGMTIGGAVALPLNIALFRKATKRTDEIEAELEELDYEPEAQAPLPESPALMIPLIAVRF
jgi:hypothetical protein